MKAAIFLINHTSQISSTPSVSSIQDISSIILIYPMMRLMPILVKEILIKPTRVVMELMSPVLQLPIILTVQKRMAPPLVLKLYQSRLVIVESILLKHVQVLSEL